jgi:hypothetical protein
VDDALARAASAAGIGEILLNARRHLAKLGRRLPYQAQIDPASSGRWFDGWKSNREPPREPSPVAAPGTWLLAVGWRRHGLIDLAEVPGQM